MNYISTRNKSLNFDFSSIFLRGLAPDGGLFLPNEIKKFSENKLKELSKLNYIDLGVEIISEFCIPVLNKNKIKLILEKAYSGFNTKNIVEIKKIDNINLLELYHGPTLAFKDIAMQVIGLMYEALNLNEKKINIIVATSGDTGSAAIAALKEKKNINLFVLHPHKKISNIQRKIMTTCVSNNIYNIAVKGNFDDCQKIVKQMFNDEQFREKINMSGVNSINWARIICQIVYYFYAYFQMSSKVNFSVPTGNFGDVYAGYLAKKLGLPINKLIVATNQNDILHRAISKGKYEAEHVSETISPSMDIQIASNFERLIYDLNNHDSSQTLDDMKTIKQNGKYSIDDEKLKKINQDFLSARMSEQETLDVIKNIYEKFNMVLDPHTAIGYGAFDKHDLKGNNIVLATAHPCKFPDAILKAINLKSDLPNELKFILDEKENYGIIENNLKEIKQYILGKIK